MSFTAQDMDRVLDEFQPQTVALLRSKAKDYASTTDRLKNFREVAAATGLSPSRVCLVYLHKHLNALGTMSDQGTTVWSWVKPDGSEGAKQRVADAINYLYLLAALFEDEAKPEDVSLDVQLALETRP